MNTVRPDLPPMPSRIAKLPVDARGYPVPWFVAWLDGVPDFRIVHPEKMVDAVRHRLCWICGERMGAYLAFTVGPMCALNQTSGEPPSHRECAIFAAQACPFLTKPQVVRRENDLPAKITINVNHLDRNPGVALVWVTKQYSVIRNTNDTPLFHMFEPTEVLFFCQGRKALHGEVMNSIDSGLPVLIDAAKHDGPAAERELERRYQATKVLVEANCA